VNLGVLTDVFCRIGGTGNAARDASVETMLRLHSGNGVPDHMWLWRLDHLELCQGEAPNPPGSEYHLVAEEE